MSTQSPTLTTEELRDRCEAEAGVRFSVHQLGDYVVAGLLPASIPGRGRGRTLGGAEARRWPAECLERLVLIARSRPGKYVNIHHAAKSLEYQGFPLLQPEILRDLADDYIKQAERRIGQKRPYLKQKTLRVGEKRGRVKEHFARRGVKAQPADTLKAMAIDSAAALAAPDRSAGDTTVAALASFFSPQRFRDALETADDDELMGAYTEAAGVANYVGPYMGVLAMMLQSDDQESPSAADFAGSLRLLVMLMLLAYKRQRSTVDERIAQVEPGALDPVTELIASWDISAGTQTGPTESEEEDQ